MAYTILQGQVYDHVATLGANSVQCVVTSPPYWDQRDYGMDGQIGDELTPFGYVETLKTVFRDVRRVLKDDGILWLNLGDTYAGGKRGRGDSGSGGRFAGPKLTTRRRGVPAGFKNKDLIGIPWRVAIALQEDGWYLRSDVIWHKTNAMPEGLQYIRPTRAHEYVFMLTKSERYFYNADEAKEPCEKSDKLRNIRTVWPIPTGVYTEAHFAVFPERLAERCILAGSRQGDVVLDPFCGSGTAGMVAVAHKRDFIGIELNPEYVELAHKRIGEGSDYLRRGLDV